jgi:hypothetical protein
LQTLTICMHYIDVFTYLNICVRIERGTFASESIILLLTCVFPHSTKLYFYDI